MSTFTINKDSVSFNVMDDEAVIIHTETSDYFSMNETGTFIWKLLAERHCSSDELVHALSTVSEQNSDDIRPDIEDFLNTLKEEALLLVARESSSSVNEFDDLIPLTEPYTVPDIVKFGNLETLILSAE